MVPEPSQLEDVYDIHAYNSIATSLRNLATLGFFEFGVSLGKQRVIEGFDSVEPDVLAQQILDIRQTNRVLLAMNELALKIEERKH